MPGQVLAPLIRSGSKPVWKNHGAHFWAYLDWMRIRSSTFTRWESTAHHTHQRPDWGITSLSNQGSMAHVPFTKGLDSAHRVCGLTSARNWGSLVHISLTVGPDSAFLDWGTICARTDWVGSCYTHQKDLDSVCLVWGINCASSRGCLVHYTHQGPDFM